MFLVNSDLKFGELHLVSIERQPVQETENCKIKSNTPDLKKDNKVLSKIYCFSKKLDVKPLFNPDYEIHGGNHGIEEYEALEG